MAQLRLVMGFPCLFGNMLFYFLFALNTQAFNMYAGWVSPNQDGACRRHPGTQTEAWLFIFVINAVRQNAAGAQ